MKRSICALFGVVLYLGFALSGLAATFTGKGIWISTKGSCGDYTVGASIEQNEDDNVNISQTLKFGDKTLDINLIIQKSDDNFFEVFSADTNEVIGNGYCFPLAGPEEKICHSDGFVGEEFIENTIKITSQGIYRMGSSTNFSTQEKIIWKDELQPSPQE